MAYFYSDPGLPGVCAGVLAIKVDGKMLTAGNKKALIPLADDGETHKVLIVLG